MSGSQRARTFNNNTKLPPLSSAALIPQLAGRPCTTSRRKEREGTSLMFDTSGIERRCPGRAKSTEHRAAVAPSIPRHLFVCSARCLDSQSHPCRRSDRTEKWKRFSLVDSLHSQSKKPPVLSASVVLPCLWIKCSVSNTFPIEYLDNSWEILEEYQCDPRKS